MIRFKSMSSDGITVITRLRNELISICDDYQIDSFESRLLLADDIIKIIDKYLYDPLSIQFIVFKNINNGIVLHPISPEASELFILLEL